MKSRFLRRIRILFAVFFLLSTTLMFVDFRDIIPDNYTGWILFLQFVPSVVKFLTHPAILSAGFIVVLLLTLLTGRTYCSAICPLGVCQDIGSRAGGLLRKRYRRFGYGKPLTILRYTLLAITIAVALTGSLFMISLLDPYSQFGRIAAYLIKPLVLAGNNVVAGVMNHFDNYSVYRVDLRGAVVMAYLIPVIFLLLAGAMSVMRGRLYCNTVCPVGTFLGLVSKVSVFRIRISESDCSRCGRCAVACKASCIDFISRSVDVSRCVGCFNCIQACPDHAISYGAGSVLQLAGNREPDKSRRLFTAGILVFIAGGGRLASGKDTPVPKKQSTVHEEKNLPVCMPGATTLENFLTRCTACALCVSACPKNVIQPSVTEYGLTGIMQPRMDYHKGFCNYECIICTTICPTGALMPLDKEAKKLTQLGIARFIRENCIVHTEKTDCGACSEHCPTKAVQMVPYEGSLVIPDVTDDICIGCGACEYACPTAPYKAIFVDGNIEHIAAKKPDTGKAVLETTDFPF